MQQNLNRVRSTQEIATVPDFVALSKALQDDMLEAAQHIRNALYDNPHMETLAIALIALDFPHFIPIENTLDALYEELERLRDELFACELFNDEFYRIDKQLDSVQEEIKRRENPSFQVKETSDAAMARYHELYNNQTYKEFRAEALRVIVQIDEFDPIDICNILTDAAIEMCHIALFLPVPPYYDGKTKKLGVLLQNFGEINLKALNHLANFSSRELNGQIYNAGIKDGE